MICAREDCDISFEPKTHNQKYCSDSCCRIATNIKIKQKYYEKRDRLKGVSRYCKNKGCSNKLSRYNAGDTCEMCNAKQKRKNRQDLLDILNGVV